jgi:hypothetical protein
LFVLNVPEWTRVEPTGGCTSGGKASAFSGECIPESGFRGRTSGGSSRGSPLAGPNGFRNRELTGVKAGFQRELGEEARRYLRRPSTTWYAPQVRWTSWSLEHTFEEERVSLQTKNPGRASAKNLESSGTLPDSGCIKPPKRVFSARPIPSTKPSKFKELYSKMRPP